MTSTHSDSVLRILQDGPQEHNALRTKLTRWGIKMRRDRFDGLMATLEKSGQVVGYSTPGGSRHYEVPK